ncbi:Gfo/Idh/MocA family protein [Humisphaera borealis]|uniref:Gfo/Idh/MocA family oxidoreductase n=1 Tax=Humisphaera borealis TaxID=2807512 RepID=A0A7M2WSX1_9BACT|nr:Gfo/Idh/MocA family oxidoreductase [Humisphaera borealis]QOV88519.1 Gfo/Idh/MocA family oxidoreductase [Humisphaera borealis]
MSVPEISPSERIPVAVVGCGRMGRLHARVYSEMPQVKLVGVCDADSGVAEAVAQQYNCGAFKNPQDLLAANPNLGAATIAVPTVFHSTVGELLMRAGVNCLIEKPLAKDVADARHIAAVAKETGVTVQVGHIERFNPAVRAMGRLGIKPRFIEVTRISPLTFRSIDVGVVLDMMIHDIDIVLRLADCEVSRIDATGVSVIGNVEDICNARLTFANGCVANVTASRLALKTERRLRVFSPDAYVSIDYQKRYGMVARRSENLEAIRQTVTKIRAGEIRDLSQVKFDEIVQIEELQIDDIEPLRAELDSFISAVVNKTTPEVTVEHGLAAVEVATRIVESIKTESL